MADDKVLCSDCGHEVAADGEAELLEEIRRHAREAHGVVFSVEEALLVVLRSQLGLSSEQANEPVQRKEGAR
jgi:predicted small metal-binding protein